MRSIPAPAGEPAPIRAGSPPRRVYPRACGGTAPAGGGAAPSDGLSPRLRGNQVAFAIRAPAHRSIPAPAGEPRSSPRAQVASPVYPRACGGTLVSTAVGMYVGGLSPRLRGNPGLVAKPVQGLGSIPAPAGEPKLKPRWDVHLSGADDQLGYAAESLSSVLGE